MLLELTTIPAVEWSRWQFALTAMYHYMFVPLTLGLALMVAIMETVWARTGNPHWLHATKFWMKLFGINFAIGVATGLILEFQFGTNWSNYSWFVGDIFGAPLAIEGILAFFMESTFVAVMFFGWHKVSRRFHLISTWLVFVGANISALWILVANAWMQDPVGMTFNPDTARNEMQDFWAVLLSPTALCKFTHTVTSAYTLSACFVVGVSSWFILKRRHVEFSRRSILLASIVGFVSILLTMQTGDKSAVNVTRTQPMKLAAMEGLNEGGRRADFTLFGILRDDPALPYEGMKSTSLAIKVPGMLSILGYHDANAFVPGIRDIIEGYTAEDGSVVLPMQQRMANGRVAIDALADYKQAIDAGNQPAADTALQLLRANYADFGYGYLSSPDEAIPHVPLVFYSFRIMVGLGMLFFLLFILSFWYAKKREFHKFRFIPYLALLCVPCAYIASQCGWIVAELGRQPWVVQDLLPTHVAATDISAAWVQTTFWMFALLFTILLVAELKIMCHQIKKGPSSPENNQQ